MMLAKVCGEAGEVGDKARAGRREEAGADKARGEVGAARTGSPARTGEVAGRRKSADKGTSGSGEAAGDRSSGGAVGCGEEPAKVVDEAGGGAPVEEAATVLTGEWAATASPVVGPIVCSALATDALVCTTGDPSTVEMPNEIAW